MNLAGLLVPALNPTQTAGVAWLRNGAVIAMQNPDIARLADEIGTLRYTTEYRFESGAPYWQTLRAADIRGILVALHDRGFVVCRDNEVHVEAPSICATEDVEQKTVA